MTGWKGSRLVTDYLSGAEVYFLFDVNHEQSRFKNSLIVTSPIDSFLQALHTFNIDRRQLDSSDLMPSLDTLPVELLAFVFGLVMSSVHTVAYDQELLRLCLLSRKLNTVIQNTASLWVVINTACNSVQYVTKAISKSKGEPLIVIIAPKPYEFIDDSYLDSFMPLLLGQCDRWSCLRIAIWHKSLHFVRAHRLKYLHLETIDFGVIDGDFPGLKDLRSDGGWLLSSLATNSLAGLRRLEVSNLDDDERRKISSKLFKSVLNSNPQVEFLRFEGCISTAPFENDIPPNSLSLPCLHTFVVDTLDGLDLILAEEVLLIGSRGSFRPNRLVHLRCLDLAGWLGDVLRLEELVRVLQANLGMESLKFAGSITNRGTRSASDIDIVVLPCLRSFIIEVEEDWMLIAFAKSVQADHCQCVQLRFRNGRLGLSSPRDEAAFENSSPLHFVKAPIRYEAKDLSETSLQTLIRRMRPQPISLMICGTHIDLSVQAGDQTVRLKVLTGVHDDFVGWLSSEFPEFPIHIDYNLDETEDGPYTLTHIHILRGVERFSIDSSALGLWFGELQSWPLPDLTHLMVRHEYDDELEEFELKGLAVMLKRREDWNRLRRIDIFGDGTIPWKTVKLLQKSIEADATLKVPDGTSLSGLAYAENDEEEDEEEEEEESGDEGDGW